MYKQYARDFDQALTTFHTMSNWLWSNALDWFGGNTSEEFSDRLAHESRRLDEDWQRGARAIEAHYFDAFHNIAIGDDEAIESLRRQRMRLRVLEQVRSAEPFGAATDLIALVAKVDAAIAFNPAVRDMLQEYEIKLDDLLRKFDEYTIVRSPRVHEASDAVRAAKSAGLPTDALLQTFAA